VKYLEEHGNKNYLTSDLHFKQKTISYATVSFVWSEAIAE
jgi:hypothetical protein